MEDTVIRSQFAFSGRSAALACSRTTHRSRQLTNVVWPQKAQTTSDYMRSLFFTGLSVDSPLGSFFPVLPAPGTAIFLVRKYFPSRRVPRLVSRVGRLGGSSETAYRKSASLRFNPASIAPEKSDERTSGVTRDLSDTALISHYDAYVTVGGSARRDRCVRKPMAFLNPLCT